MDKLLLLYQLLHSITHKWHHLRCHLKISIINNHQCLHQEDLEAVETCQLITHKVVHLYKILTTACMTLMLHLSTIQLNIQLIILDHLKITLQLTLELTLDMDNHCLKLSQFTTHQVDKI